MHSAILAVQLPPENHAGRQTWQGFSAMIAGIEGNPALRQLGPNVWQVDFRKAPAVLARLVVACDQFELPYEILPLENASAWIQGGLPKATGVRNAGSWEGSED
jgi:hypothetical protein